MTSNLFSCQIKLNMRETISVGAVVATFDDFSLFSVFFVFLSISAIFATLLFTGRPGGLLFQADPNRQAVRSIQMPLEHLAGCRAAETKLGRSGFAKSAQTHACSCRRRHVIACIPGQWRLLSIGNVQVLRFAEWPLPCTYYGRGSC